MCRAFLFALAPLILCYSAKAQQHTKSAHSLTPAEKVDSAFSNNFFSIEKNLAKHQPPSLSESRFIYVLGFLSGQSFFPIKDYSGVPQLNQKDLLEAKEWYRLNRSRIKWPKLKRGFELISAIPTDETVAELEALKIK
jgi:hypothetical protein